MNENDNILIDLDQIFKSKAPKVYKKTPRFLINFLKKTIHLDEINEILLYGKDHQGVDFMNKAIEYFNVKFEVEGLNEIPTEGRYIFASNHPLGGFDGICLTSIIGEHFNHKVKYIVNDLLFNLKPLQSIFVPVNKHGKQSKDAISLQTEAFKSDNQIITFPAGLCSRKENKIIRDLEWKKTFISKAIETQRDIVPVYFDGANSNFFYRFANIRKKIGVKFNAEMLFLPDEMFKNKNKTFKIIFGKPISYTMFDNTKTLKEWAQYVKEESYKLASK